MRFGCRLVILAVLLCSTAVFSTTSGDFDVRKCSLGSLNLCNNLSQDELDQSYENKEKALTPDQLSCNTCNLLTLIMKERFESTKREDMIERVLHECYSLTILSETCANMVFNYFDIFYELAKEQLQSNKICAVSGICADNAWKRESNEVISGKKHDQFYCAECKKIATHVHESLIKNTTEAQFKAKLSGFCKKTQSFKSECVRIVDQYSHVAYSMLKNMKPESICLIIGVCHNKRMENIEEHNDEVLVELSKEIDFSEEVILITDAVAKDSENCVFCKNIIKTLQELVKSHHDITNVLKFVCHGLKEQSLRDKCHNMIDKHSDLIIDLVAKNAAYQQICRNLNMCLLLEQETTEIEMSLPLKQNQFEDYKSNSICAYWKQFVSGTDQLAETMSPRSGPFCVICELLVARFKASLDTKAKRDGILHMFLFTCDVLPDFIRKPCHNIVQGYGAAVLHLISTVQPHDVCQILQTSANQTVLEDFDKAFNEYLDTNCDVSTS